MRAKETLFEFYEEGQESIESGYMSSSDDNELDKVDKSTTRKRPRLTLQHLNKLRKMRKMKRKEQIAHLDVVSRMYGNKSDEEM